MPIPGFQDLMRPVLQASSEGEVRISDVVEKLASEFALSDEEKSQLIQSGKQTVFSNRVHWAKSYLGMAGLVEMTKRAHFKITDDGKKTLQTHPKQIDIKYLKTIPMFRKSRDVTNESSNGPSPQLASDEQETLTPNEAILEAYKLLNVSLASELMDRIQSKSPSFFEGLAVHLLVKMGYGGSYDAVGKALTASKYVQGGPNDHGVDGVIDQDMLGLDRVYVQVKRYAEDNKISEADIRTFFGSLDGYRANKGVFVTSSSFSEPAALIIVSSTATPHHAASNRSCETG